MKWNIIEAIPRSGGVRIIGYQDGAPVTGEDGVPTILDAPEAPENAMPIGLVDGRSAFAVEQDGDVPTRTLLDLFRAGAVEPTEFALLSRGKHLLEWRANHQFCGRCGSHTRFLTVPTRTTCLSCGMTTHPRISPCVIVLVHDGERVLLVRSKAPRVASFHSCVAGFVEAGETLEQAVVREVKEETGVNIDHLTYFGSQPWPFPDQLMIGFHARYASGDIVIGDSEEIADARWFIESALPRHPSSASIAGQLIHSHFENRSRN